MEENALAQTEEEILDQAGEDVTPEPPESVEGEPGAPEQDTPEISGAEAEPPQPRKSGVQKRIDELVREREYWKQVALERQQSPPPAPEVPKAAPPESMPREDDYESYTDYVRAVAKYETRQEIRQEQEQRQRAAADEARAAWFSTARQRYDDFVEVISGIPISVPMADALLADDAGINIAYHLGKNPELAAKIAKMSPVAAIREIGRIESQLSAGVKPRSKTDAPRPTAPVGTKEGAVVKLEDMSQAEYEAYMNQREKPK